MQGETNSATAESESPPSPDEVMPAAAQQPSHSHPSHALCNQRATATPAADLATGFPLRPPARKQMGALGFGILLQTAQTRERKKKTIQTAAYP